MMYTMKRAFTDSQVTGILSVLALVLLLLEHARVLLLLEGEITT